MSDTSSIIWVFAGVAVLLGVIMAVLRHPRCPRCNLRMKLMRSEDDLGINITNKIRISLASGVPRYEHNTYKCRRCGSEVRQKFVIWR